jgi:hypothetical protein
VKVLADRADYVDVVVSGERFEYRFLLPPTDDCRAIAAADDARYTNWGVLGTLRRDELRCEPVGILSLEKWRDRRPRSKGPPVPREQAVYDVFYRDDELALARGRFVLAGKIGFSGGVDSVAVIPNTDECRGVLSRRVSSMEFRPAGPNPLVLIDGDGRCPLLGIARPLGPPPPPEK